MIQESNYHNFSNNPALRTFQSLGYNEKTLIKKQKLRQILDQLSQKYRGQPFKDGIFDQFWEQSEANSRGQVQIGTVASVMVQANSLLQKKIAKLEGPSGLINMQEGELKMKQQQLKELQEFEHYDFSAINSKRMQISTAQLCLNEYYEDLRNFKVQRAWINQLYTKEQKQEQSIIQPKPFKEDKYSGVLLLTFHLTNIAMVLELLACTYRINFLAIMTLLQIYFFLFLGYFSDHSVAYAIIQLLLSILLDLAWLALHLLTAVYIAPQRYPTNFYFYLACLVFLIGEVLLKLVLLLNLVPYRTVRPENEYFVFLGEKVWLNKRSNRGVSFRMSQYY